MKALFAGILLFFAGNIMVMAHPIHVSVCNIEFSQTESVILIKLFSDDFGMAIHNNYNQELDLSKADEYPYRNFISNYISSNLQLFSGRNKNLKYTYDYSELDELSIWLYFKVEKVNPSDKLRIINTLMLDLYQDQTNLLIINHEGTQNGFRFNYMTRELEIELK